VDFRPRSPNSCTLSVREKRKRATGSSSMPSDGGLTTLTSIPSFGTGTCWVALHTHVMDVWSPEFALVEFAGVSRSLQKTKQANLAWHARTYLVLSRVHHVLVCPANARSTCCAPRYVVPMRAGRLIDTPRHAARFVSLLASRRTSSVGASERTDSWQTMNTFVSLREGG